MEPNKLETANEIYPKMEFNPPPQLERESKGTASG